MAKGQRRVRPTLQSLEDRLNPYTLSGSQWANVNVSVSFLPDGAITDSGKPSNLFATLDAIAPTATWQAEFARALQTWASITPLNFHFVADSGAASGAAGSAQGDSRFGDIRLGGYASTAWSGFTYFPSGGTLGGDEFLNTATTWHIGSTPDLYSILLHETGHALGLDHTSVSPAVMRPAILTVYTGLFADDIAGIQAIYGVRPEDAYDAGPGNDSFSKATSLTLNGDGTIVVNADLTTLADVDYFRVTAPANSDGSLTVTLDARNLSLLTPRISVYDANQNLVGTYAATGFGSTATVQLSGLAAGQTYYFVADGATSDVFGMGSYKLTAQFGVGMPLPSVSISNTSLAEGNTGVQSATFTVTLSAASSNPVSVQYATADGTATAGSDYSATSGTLTFAPGETQKTIVVAVNGDTVPEADETFLVNLSNPTNAVVGVSQGTGMIQNDDLGADPLEVNDAAATATKYGSTNSINQTGLTLNTAVDQDYFRFTPTRKGTFKVTIATTQGAGTFNLAVYNSALTLLSSNKTQTGALTLTLSLAGGKYYYVRAMSSTGDLFGYALTVAKQGGAKGVTGSGDGIGTGDATNVSRANWPSIPERSPSAGTEMYSTTNENSTSIRNVDPGSGPSILQDFHFAWSATAPPGEWNVWSPVGELSDSGLGVEIDADSTWVAV